MKHLQMVFCNSAFKASDCFSGFHRMKQLGVLQYPFWMAASPSQGQTSITPSKQLPY